MEPAQVRMARAALNWSMQQLAAASGVHRNTISNFETGRYGGSEEALKAIRRALEAAGVEFIPENGGGAGVRLKYNRQDTRNIARFEGEGGTPGEDDVQ